MSRESWNKEQNKIGRIYLFCEWKTEKFYFEKIIKLNQNYWVKLKFIDLWWWSKVKTNPEWIARTIYKTVKENKSKKYDDKMIYLLFDLDIFSCLEIENSIKILTDKHIIPIVTNECFEYWILSHFEKYNLWKRKYIYLDRIKNELSKIGFTLSKDKFTWEKHKFKWDYDWLNKENIKLAIKNVKEVNNLSNWNLKNRDPYSNVYEIIEFLES